ncbi:hypothetical protein DQ04_00011390 [Trypanosoma grayi]|uniref:hypothetical protein n=1 Tax=Trypanosoma grayi TaxID=71804 RepID=UPI0004F452CA|nr:hypothetical protein DQ04_00011390 [Trypanosoma grayi]KEG15672.1 hypothetical protein DQ04_00011390 [Trypanosoma grayi]
MIEQEGAIRFPRLAAALFRDIPAPLLQHMEMVSGASRKGNTAAKNGNGANNNNNVSENGGCKRVVQGAGANQLMQTEYGITPESNAAARECRPHIHPQRYVRSKEAEYRGKKHIDPHHMNLSDEAKREEGRYGKRHISTVAQGRGQSDFSISAMGDNNGTAQNRPNSSPRSKTMNTSVQLAEARVRKLAEDPRYQQAAREVLQHAGSVSIVQEEERLLRRVAAEQYAAGSEARCAELRSYNRPVDLGQPGDAIQAHVPFALDESAPRPDNAQEHRTAHYRNVESKPERQQQQQRRRGGGYDAQRHLRDNIVLSQNDYPDPPAVGVRVVPRVAPRPSSAQKESTECLGNEAALHSRARGAQRPKQGMPDFIFGAPPQLEPQRRTLRGDTEERWKAEEDRAAQRRTGRAMARQSHRPTALW